MEKRRWMVVMTTLAAGLMALLVRRWDREQLGELAGVVRGLVVGELVVGLLAEVAAIDEEQDRAGVGVAEAAVASADGRVRLAGAHRHLDERPRVGSGQRSVQPGQGTGLHGPERRIVHRRQFAERSAERPGLGEDPGEGFRTGEVEEFATAGSRIEAIGKLDDGAVGLEQEREGASVCRQRVRQAMRILG
jgi:hypothetical protein